MSTDTRAWTRIGTMTLLLEVMGQPAYVYTASSNTDRAVELATHYHGSPLDYGEGEEYWAECLAEGETDYPALDGDEVAETFLAEQLGSEITVIPVWPSEVGLI